VVLLEIIARLISVFNDEDIHWILVVPRRANFKNASQSLFGLGAIRLRCLVLIMEHVSADILMDNLKFSSLF